MARTGQFKEVLSRLQVHSDLVGIDLKPSDEGPRFNSVFTCHVLGFNVFMVMEIVVVAHEVITSQTLDTFRLLGVFCFLQCGLAVWSSYFSVFWRKKDLQEIIRWCEKAHEPPKQVKNASLWSPIFQQARIKSIFYTTWFLRLVFIYLAVLAAGATLSKVFLDDGFLTIMLYKSDGYVQEFPWYWIISAVQIAHSYSYFVVYSYNFSILSVILEQVHGQLDYICGLIRNLKGFSKTNKVTQKVCSVKERKTEALNDIIKIHSETLEVVQKISKLFSFPLLMAEITPLACFGLVGITLFVKKSEYHVCWSALGIVVSCAIYAHFGQTLIGKAQDVSQEAYFCPWYDSMTSVDKKKLQVVMIMGQKDTALTAGSFHNVDYSQFLEIVQRGYNIMLTISHLFT